MTPEESESLSYGIVYNPSFVEGLDLSIDIWDVKIDSVITSVGFQQILDSCSPNATGDDATHPIVPFCGELLVRAPSGIPATFINPLVNSGTLETNGLDFDITYGFESGFGDFKFTLDATYTDVYRLVSAEGVAQANQAGRNLGDAGYPRWKSNFNTTWTYEDFSVNYSLQFLGDQTEDCGLSANENDTWACSDLENGFNHLGSTVYHDIQGSYYLSDYSTRLTLGINNIFDKTPPISTQAFANSFDASLYDPTGRFFYARATLKF